MTPGDATVYARQFQAMLILSLSMWREGEKEIKSWKKEFTYLIWLEIRREKSHISSLARLYSAHREPDFIKRCHSQAPQ